MNKKLCVGNIIVAGLLVTTRQGCDLYIWTKKKKKESVPDPDEDSIRTLISSHTLSSLVTAQSNKLNEYAVSGTAGALCPGFCPSGYIDTFSLSRTYVALFRLCLLCCH